MLQRATRCTFVLAAFIVLCTGCGDDDDTPGFPEQTVGFAAASLTINGASRGVQLYFPENLASSPALVIACHGTGGTAEDGIWEVAGDELAESEGVLIAAPQARTMPDGDWDQHGPGDVYFETYPNLDPNDNDDLLLVAAIIDEAKRAYDIDDRRVYIAGFSNGAFFAQFAAMRLPDRIAAFVSSSGGLVRCGNTSDCNFAGTATTCAGLAVESDWCDCAGTEKPGPILTTGRKPGGWIAHAADDSTVSPYYSCALADRMQELSYDVHLELRASGGHGSPSSLLPTAWSFLSAQVLP